MFKNDKITIATNCDKTSLKIGADSIFLVPILHSQTQMQTYLYFCQIYKLILTLILIFLRDIE